MGRPSIQVKLTITSKDGDRFSNQERSILFQMLHPQMVLQIEELEQLTIRSESQCEGDREKSITSRGKNRICQLERSLPGASGLLQRSVLNVQRL